MLLSTSPGIDAGDPLSPYSLEPGNNGGRVNLGLEGDTSYATQSAAVAVQVLSPDGLNKLQIGVPTTISYATNDVTGLEAVARINAGGSAIAGTSAETDCAAGTSSVYGSTSTASTINVSGVSSAIPESVFSNSLVAASSQKLISTTAVGNGTYVVTLDFAEYSVVGVGGRVFNILINGVEVAANFDIYKAAGDQINTAVTESFTVTVSNGSGITIELDDLTTNPAMLAGIQIDKVTASAASQTATVEVWPDNGVTWELVSNAAPIDAYGNGSITWTPNFITSGNTALVRVTVDGVAAVSRQGFLVTNAGNAYYINDNSTAGAEYSTAVGNDLNSGKTPDAPMADLAALLRAYPNLGADAIIYVDPGAYQELTDVTLGAGDDGATIQGPTAGTATFNRENLSGNDFQLAGAQNVTIENLTLTGGGDGILLNSNVNSVGVTVSNVIIENSENYGIYVGSGDSGFTLNASEIFGSVNGVRDTGVYLLGAFNTPDSATITNDQIFGQYIAISDQYYSGLISDNSIHDNAYQGIYVETFVGA